MSDTDDQTDQDDLGLPAPARGVTGYLGRPVWAEFRSIRELRRLKGSTWWQGYGMPEGHSRPVLLIAGFLAGPRTVDALEHVLVMAGWRATQAEVGRNAGPAYHGVEQSEKALKQLYRATRQKVRVIGHSRGGQYGRVLAVRYPEMVEQVITLGSPLCVKYPKYAVVKLPAEALDRLWRTGLFGAIDKDAEQDVDDDRFVPFPPGIDFVSIYSKSDGIVDWRTSLDPDAHLIEINASHAGLPNSIAGINAVAIALKRC